MNYKKIIFKFSFLAFLFSMFFLFSSSASADATCKCNNGDAQSFDCSSCAVACISYGGYNNSCVVNLPSLKAASPTPPNMSQVKPQVLPNPLGITDINTFIATIINFVLSLVGSVSLLLFVYGGVTWMTSMGNPTQIKKGRDIVLWAIIGLAVVFTSYILVKFVIVGITTVA